MDPLLKKNASESASEPKKESRLTSIIDQLLISKKKDEQADNSDTAGKEDERSPEGRDGPVTAKQHPESGGRGQQPPLVAGVTSEAARAATVSSPHKMPADTLAAVQDAAVPIKPERFSPDVESSSPSVSPHSPSPARAFPAAFGLRPPATLTGSAPALKQMEMMTRNYSDFMRSLAAKYNNQSPQDSSLANGLTYPFKTSSTPPLLGRTAEADSNGRKSDGSPPLLLDSRFPPYNLADFSSSQTLLNLVRTASAQSASQLENYLRGAAKRSLDEVSRGDPLDLSSKRLRSDLMPSPHGSRDQLREMVELDLGLRLSSATAKKSLLHASPGRVRTCPSMCAEQSCSSEAGKVAQWTVDQVVDFVASQDSCSEYADKFREQSIDGASLSLLTEDHLTAFLGMKLGPALRLRASLAKKIGHCTLCMHCIHCHKGGEQPEPCRSPPLSK